MYDIYCLIFVCGKFWFFAKFEIFSKYFELNKKNIYINRYIYIYKQSIFSIFFGDFVSIKKCFAIFFKTYVFDFFRNCLLFFDFFGRFFFYLDPKNILNEASRIFYFEHPFTSKHNFVIFTLDLLRIYYINVISQIFSHKRVTHGRSNRHTSYFVHI